MLSLFFPTFKTFYRKPVKHNASLHYLYLTSILRHFSYIFKSFCDIFRDIKLIHDKRIASFNPTQPVPATFDFIYCHTKLKNYEKLLFSRFQKILCCNIMRTVVTKKIFLIVQKDFPDRTKRFSRWYKNILLSVQKHFTDGTKRFS